MRSRSFSLARGAAAPNPALLAQAATLVLPLALLYSRALAEVLIGVVDGAFLLHAAAAGEWRWLRRPWTLAALPFWAWLVVCSALGPGGWPSVVQALVAVRFFVFAAALGEFVLESEHARRWLWVMVAAGAAWIALECWQQYLLGANLFGAPRWGDGALTGPFDKPRAGAAFALVLFPALLPPAASLIAARPGWLRPLGGGLLIVAGVATMVLIGQRMPALLTLLGLAVAGLLLPRIRPALLGALLAGGALVAALPAVSPPTYAKLVVHFRAQMDDFAQSPYGLLFTRATVMTEDHPLFGLGFRGFRFHCREARYDAGIAWLGIAGTANASPEKCNLHPHNFYLEAATESGLPGLAAFAGMVVVWLMTLGRGLIAASATGAPPSPILSPRKRGERRKNTLDHEIRIPPHPLAGEGFRGAGTPLRVALFVTALMALWPLASTSEFFSVPNCGWLFLMLGWGFAEARSSRRNLL